MKFFNVHRTNVTSLQQVLNAHALRGWDVHHIRGISMGNGKDHLAVVFVREFTDEKALHAYLDERFARHNRNREAAIAAGVDAPAEHPAQTLANA